MLKPTPLIIRWYLILGCLALVAGMAFTPDADVGQISTDEAQWTVPVMPTSSINQGQVMQLTQRSWWGGNPTAQGQGGSASADPNAPKNGRVTYDEDGTPRIKVSWFFQGTVQDKTGVYALIAKDAKSAPERFVVGDLLPDGERLERIDGQSIRFSLEDEDEIKNFDRTLYAPF